MFCMDRFRFGVCTDVDRFRVAANKGRKHGMTTKRTAVSRETCREIIIAKKTRGRDPASLSCRAPLRYTGYLVQAPGAYSGTALFPRGCGPWYYMA